MAFASRCAVLTALVLLGVLIPALSSQTDAPVTGVAFSASSAQLKAAAAAVPVSPEHPAEILYEEGIYKFASNGTLIYQHRLIYRVDSQSAVQGWSEVSATWDPWFEKPAQLHARVLQVDGNFVELDQKTITDTPVKADDAETFSSERERRAPLPGMAAGAIVEEQEITEENTPYFAYGSLNRYSFRSGVPVARARVSVELPISTPFKDRILRMPHMKVERTEQGGLRKVIYEAANLDATHDSDIDLATNDPLTGALEFATGESWGSVAQHYAEMVEAQIVPAEAKAILPAHLPADRMSRIKAIVKAMHHEVRYTGVEFGAARLTPMRPEEVIKRHYGDCKDKATLLVAMLRAADIKADLALLSTGPGRDVADDLPGMNWFDHAIVYLPPAATGEQPLWIDATAEHLSVGSLPYEDEGRNALVVSTLTTGLTKTPAPKAEDSILIESRTFKLAEFGPSQVEESSDTQGWIDATYRSSYGGPETPKLREDLDKYVKNAYLAKKLTKLEHGETTDLEKPFHLSLSAVGAKRGNSSLNDAVVVIYPNGTLNNLPSWFSEKPPVIGPDTTTDQKRDIELGEKARPASFSVRPYVFEQRSRILIPAGFVARALPEDKVTLVGPGTLTETYKTSEPGVIEVSFKFNTGPAEVTAAQALAMRDAVLDLNKRDYVAIYFDQAGMKALTAGHIREALETDRKLIAADPTGALHHMRLSRVLLEAGIGDEAHAEAKRATELDPKLGVGFSNYAWTLQHNTLGERFGKGFDRNAAIAAYKRALEIDEDDYDARYDLAVLYEFNARGTRYQTDADLPGAIREYQQLIDRNKEKGDAAIAQYRDNMLYALLYSRRFAELDQTLASVPSSNAYAAFVLTSTAAQHGPTAAIAQAEKGNVSIADRNKNLRLAGAQLANLHLYSEAADLISAGMQGGEDAATAARQVQLYKNLKPASLTPLPPTDPVAPVQMGLVGLMAGTLSREQALSLNSKHGFSSEVEFQKETTQLLTNQGFLRLAAQKSGIEESVLLDLIIGNTKFQSKGSEDLGFDVVAMIPGTPADHTYVVKEGGAYRIAGDGDKDDPRQNSPLGNVILWELSQGRSDIAKAMLDWKRDLQHKGGGDDPLEGSLMPRFWTIGATTPGADSPETMKLAAISLLAGSMAAKPYLPQLAKLRDQATGQRRTDLELLLATSALDAEDTQLGMPAAQGLLEQEPDSLTALKLVGRGYALQGDAAGWLAVLEARLAKKPADHDLMVQQSRAYELAQDWKNAQATQQKVIDSGKATASDYNSYAWTGLFHDSLGEDVIKAAQQGALMQKNSTFPELHTLACVYAAQGKTTEASQVLKQAMAAGSFTEPNSEVWFALGMIYEQYGEKEAALAAYRKVSPQENEDRKYIDPIATYVLAQNRLKALSK